MTFEHSCELRMPNGRQEMITAAHSNTLPEHLAEQ